MEIITSFYSSYVGFPIECKTTACFILCRANHLGQVSVPRVVKKAAISFYVSVCATSHPY